MKTLKFHHLVIAGSFLLASCSTVNYLGDQFTPTTKTDVYYDAKDIKQDYKVIGHLSAAYSSTQSPSVTKDKFSAKAQAMGADAIIILQTTGNTDHEMVRADAIKYNK